MKDKDLLLERQIHQGLEKLQQKVMEVGAFALKFFTRAERLVCQGETINHFFFTVWMNPYRTGRWN